MSKKFDKKEKEFRDDKKRGRKNERQAGYNDVSWYAKNPQLLVDAASFSYNRPLGSGYTISFPGGSTATKTIPGLMVNYIIPCVGISTSSYSAPNIAANNIYAFVRHMNSGSKNYDQADLMLYLLAMDNVYCYWNYLKRIYGYVTTYSQLNRYMPKAYCVADNVIFESVQANLAQFRAYLNAAAAKITSFNVPAEMSIFLRHSWLCSNIYKDSDTDKAQLWMNTLSGVYQYVEKESQYGGKLKYINLNTGKPRTYEQLIDVMESLLTPISYSEDIGIMSGDIRKAYSPEKLFKISTVEPDYTVLPVYNEEVLNQMHNARIIPVNILTTTGDLDVTQDPNTGFLLFNPTEAVNLTQQNEYEDDPNEIIINMPWDGVTPANTMVGTRLAGAFHFVGPEDAPKSKIEITALGTEIVTRRRFMWIDPVGTPVGKIEYDYLYTNVLMYQAANFDYVIKTLCAQSQFDWHPLTMLVNTSGTFIGYLGDISNYTFMTHENLNLLHSTAILSEFNVPQLGSF